jgi:hypothetical protein
MGWNFYNASGELQINDGGVQAGSAVFTGNVDLGSNLLVGNAGSTGIAISANGEVTMAAQPSVAAYNSSADNNVTGTGAGSTVTLDFDTEVYDQNADFASDTFTAPVTGRYLIVTQVSPDGLTTAANYHLMNIVASNRSWKTADNLTHSEVQPTVMIATAIIDMDAADTVTINYFLQGEASDVIDITAEDLNNRFTAQLIA